MNASPARQLTLVAFYGPDKPEIFRKFLVSCQQCLHSLLGSHFAPYDLAQIHATLIGLEAVRRQGRLVQRNLLETAPDAPPMNLRALLETWQAMKPLTIQLGGWSPKDRSFTNLQGESPHHGSCFIRHGLVGGMGWPVEQSRAGKLHPDTLYRLRRAFESAGTLLHRWHRHAAGRDNDFFFRLGTVDLAEPDPLLAHARDEMRTWLAARDPVTLPVTREDLRMVAYTDPTLPWEQDPSRHRSIETVSCDWMEQVYPS